MEYSDTRRQLLAGITASTLSGLAGCIGGGGSSQEDKENAHGHNNRRTGSSEDHDSSHSDREGESDDNHHGHGMMVPDGPAESMTVAMETRDGEPHYSPHIIWIESGGTAIFDTKAGTHTATAYHHGNGTVDRVPVDAPAWDSGTVTAEDEPYKRTFDVPGVHDFYCIPHEGQGMVGTVIVGEPENTDQPGLAKPQDELSSGAYSKIETLNDTVLGEVDSLR